MRYDKPSLESPQKEQFQPFLSLKTYLYYGSSMKGTFQLGDQLNVYQVPIYDIEPGDIVVCTQIDKQIKHSHYVHRVISIINGSLFLRGDNNNYSDNTLVNEENYLGKVVSFTRDHKTRRICGSHIGLLSAHRLALSRVISYRVMLHIKRIFYPVYYQLRRSGLVKLIWKPVITKAIFENDDELIIRYIHKGKTVARISSTHGKVWYQRPFDFILWEELHEILFSFTNLKYLSVSQETTTIVRPFLETEHDKNCNSIKKQGDSQ